MTEGQNITPLYESDDVTNKVIVTVDGEELQFDQDQLGLTFESTEEEIMNRVAPMIEESKNVDITEAYKVRKFTNTENIFILPNSTAG